MTPIALSRLRRLARKFRAADRALAAFRRDGDEPMFTPPPTAPQPRIFADERAVTDAAQRVFTALTAPIRPPQTDVEIAWVRALLEFAKQPELAGDGWMMATLLAAGDDAGVDVCAQGFVGLHRHLVGMLLGESLDPRIAAGPGAAR